MSSLVQVVVSHLFTSKHANYRLFNRGVILRELNNCKMVIFEGKEFENADWKNGGTQGSMESPFYFCIPLFN